MRKTNEREAGDWRSSVLWGTGTRGGDSRSRSVSVKGRGVLAACLAVCALLAALAGTAAPAKAAISRGRPAPADRPTWVDPGLVRKAHGSPDAVVDVIIQSTAGTSGAAGAVQSSATAAGPGRGGKGGGSVAAAIRKLGTIGAIEVKVPARQLPFLQRIPGLTVTPNAVVHLSGGGLLGGLTGSTTVGSTQLWPQVTGNNALWSGDLANPSATPAIAVVDSGVDASAAQFGSRVIANVNLSTINGNSAIADQNGHGTFVAGIAAGASANLAGADPVAPIVAIKVMDQQGSAKTSDIINACQWILDHKDQYNIRVANFSLHSSYGTNSYYDPLDQAVEKLWFSGITVVAAAGNYGNASSPSGVLYSPGNDPFVITVGALDTNDTVDSTDDGVAPWSAWGHTEDGFSKPDVAAPGRYMVQQVPLGATLLSEFPLKVQDALSGQLQISGTSFSAPVVSGTVAEMLARHPNLTPDQVKGELMQTARRVPNAPQGAAGVGEVSAYPAAHDTNPPNANLGLDQYVVADPAGGSIPVFNSVDWKADATANPAWNAVTSAQSAWTDSAWTDSAWTDSAWTDSAWTDSAWTDSAWTDSAWTDSAWTDSAWTDSAQLDESSTDASAEDAAVGN